MNDDANCNTYESILEFFANTNLTSDSQQRKVEFNYWKEQFNQLLKDAVSNVTMDENDMKIF